ncbi:hypothetical protein BZ164_02160, partial [Pseudomonas veronii]
MLKALKKMFGKSEAEPLAPVPSAPVPTPGSRHDGKQPGLAAPVTAPKPLEVTPTEPPKPAEAAA